MNLKELRRSYAQRKKGIVSRLEEFGSVLAGSRDREIFTELSFCLFTPQSKAKSCWEAVTTLKNNKLLFDGKAPQISKHLNKVRCKNTKARYVVEARERISGLMDLLDGKTPGIRGPEFAVSAREWLVKNIKGIGYKEASHFLRNIGLGEHIAILDRHILKNMKALGVIKEIPAAITPKKYLEMERKLINFSKIIKIPVSHLDLLFWSNETGEIFK